MSNNITKILIAVVLGIVFIMSAFGVYKYMAGSSTTATPGGDTMGAFPESGKITMPVGTTGGGATGGGITKQPGQTSSGATAFQTGQNGELKIKIISEKPVAGGIFINRTIPISGTTTASKLYVRYIERESGHIYELGYNESLPKKISNTTITRIHQVYTNNIGVNRLLRRLDNDNNIQNIYTTLEIGAPTTSPSGLIETPVGKLNQYLLSSNIREVAVSPRQTKIFYLTEFSGDFIGTVEDFSSKIGTNKKQVFSSPLSEWLVQWPEENTIFFNTKPASTYPGFLFSQSINRSTGLTKILGDINGLTTNVSPNMKKIVYSESISGGLKTYIYNPTTRESSIWSLTTLPEKCIWGGVEKTLLYCAVPASIPQADYPDSWYQGITSFNDELWKVDTKTGNAELLVDRATFDRSGGVDATNLVLSPQEDYILLTNKKDSSLWQIKIK